MELIKETSIADSHFCTFSSPNSIPLTTTKNIEIDAIKYDNIKVIILNHHGNLYFMIFVTKLVSL